MDLREATHFLKLSADQGNAEGQWRYGVCLQKGDGISKDLRGAAHYYQLSADQGNAFGQLRYGVCWQKGD
jgi:TPR repeat protein